MINSLKQTYIYQTNYFNTKPYRYNNLYPNYQYINHNDTIRWPMRWQMIAKDESSIIRYPKANRMHILIKLMI